MIILVYVCLMFHYIPTSFLKSNINLHDKSSVTLRDRADGNGRWNSWFRPRYAEWNWPVGVIFM